MDAVSRQARWAHLGPLRHRPIGTESPERPTLTELGCAFANLISLLGVFASAGLPIAPVAELNHLINQAAKTEVFKSRPSSTFDLLAGGLSAGDFREEIAQERARYQAMLRRCPAWLR